MTDLLIRGALVYDGSGDEPVAADVAVADGRIPRGRIETAAARLGRLESRA